MSVRKRVCGSRARGSWRRHEFSVNFGGPGEAEALWTSSIRRRRCAQPGSIRLLEPELPLSPELVELDSYYGGAELFEHPYTDLSEAQPPVMSGRCLGMIGDVLVFVQGGRRFSVERGRAGGAAGSAERRGAAQPRRRATDAAVLSPNPSKGRPPRGAFVALRADSRGARDCRTRSL